MSWKDDINKDFSIIMGDGTVFTPLWDATRSVTLVDEFNCERFNFIETKGTLVDRAEIMGSIYDVEIIFQGDDHLIHLQNFRKSSRDKRVWTINHPYYGILVVQPTGIKYNNDEGNITRINAQVIETIKAGSTGLNIDPFDKISIDKLNVDTILFSTYIEAVPTPEVKDIQAMTANIDNLAKVSPLIKISDDYNRFINGLNNAQSWANQAASYPQKAISSIQAAISIPATIIDTVTNKLSMIAYSYQALFDYALNLPTTLKRLFENNAGCAISSMCLAAVSNITSDYNTRPAVVVVMQQIAETFEDYLTKLDSLQSDNGADEDSYIPDADSMNALLALVNYTISQLQVFATSAKQLNTYDLPKNANIHNIAFELYGTAGDDVVDQLIDDNDIKFSELLFVKKGREIIYYT